MEDGKDAFVTLMRRRWWGEKGEEILGDKEQEKRMDQERVREWENKSMRV